MRLPCCCALLLQASLPDSLADTVTHPAFQPFMQRVAVLHQEQERQRQPPQQQGRQLQPDAGDLLVDWAMHRLLHLELLEMQPLDVELALKLLRFADSILGRQQQQLQPPQQQVRQQQLVLLQQSMSDLTAGFTALQQGMAAHPHSVRREARFAAAERQRLAAAMDNFALPWDVCSGEPSRTVAVCTQWG